MVLGLVAAAASVSPKASPAADSTPTPLAGAQTATLWRGVFNRDSLFVRGFWIPTVGSTSCYQSETTGADTSAHRRKYVEYRIEDQRGTAWDRGVLSEPESLQFCCDELVAEATRWPGRLIIKLTALGWYCEPAGDCSESRFIHVAGSDSVAVSAWTDVPWDPALGSYFDAWVIEGCLQYPMRLMARAQGAALEFRPSFPPEVNEGDLFEEDVNKDEDFGYCLRPFRPEKPTAVAWYQRPDSKSPGTLILRPDESVEIVSAVIRAERSDEGELVPRILLVGVRVSDRRGFLTRNDLRSLGFLGL
jgi:hypothetical protein